jgi:type IV pilus assembly protein PilX
MKRYKPISGISFRGQAFCARQQGISLAVALLMLIVIMMLGISAVHIALQGEKASRNDRDRQIAFQAAEAALIDAESDVEFSPDALRTRSKIFSRNKSIGFSEGCGAGEENPFLGLCLRAPDGSPPAWLAVDFLDTDSATMKSVPYGKFTGQIFQVGNGSLPVMLPRYIIEIMPYNNPGASAALNERTYFYRITAVGFGARQTTRVTLQAFYRKED